MDISGHVYVHYATLNIYMLLNTYVDMNMSIMQRINVSCIPLHRKSVQYTVDDCIQV